MPGEAGDLDRRQPYAWGVYNQLDGIYNMDNYLASGNPFPNTDATQEFLCYHQQFLGRVCAFMAVAVTKSGTNEWHGDAYEFDRNQFFNAPDWFSKVKDGDSRNIFGGSQGGRFRRTNTSFSATFRLRSPISRITGIN